MMKTIHLQGIGQHPAIEAKDLKVGTITVWNYGYKEKVVHIQPTKSGKSLNLIVQAEDGNLWPRQVRVDSLVGVKA